jgi:hypothetical protein
VPRTRARLAARASVLLILVATASAVATETTLPPVVVTASTYSIVDHPTAAHELDLRAAANLPLLDNDILRAAHVFPGVASNDFTARFYIRGSDRSDVGVRLDGMELYDPFHLQDFGGPMSAIEPSLVGGATLLMGAYPPSYGAAGAGVLDIRTRRPTREKRALLGLDLLKMMFAAEGPVGDGAYLFAARRGYVDLVLGIVDAIQPSDEQFRPRYTDIYTKIEHPLDGGAKLSVSSLYARDTNLIDKAGDADDLDSAYENSLTWARWRGPPSARVDVEVIPYVGYATADRIEGRLDRDGRDLFYAGAKASARLTGSGSHAPSAGFDVRLANGVYDYYETLSPFPELTVAPEVLDALAEVGGADVSAFVQDAWRLSDSVGATYGARALWQTYRDDLIVSPRAGLSVRLAPAVSWRVGLASLAQSVGPLNIPVEAGIEAAASPEWTDVAVTGVGYAPNPRLSLSVEAYYKRLRDLTGRERDVGRKSQYYRVADTGTALGWELFARGRPTARAAWAAGYTYAVSEREVDGATYPSDFDRRHSVRLHASADLSPSVGLSAAWRFNTGTPATSVAFATDTSGAVTAASVGLPDGDVRTPPFHSLDVRVTKKFELSTWGLTAYLQVTNAYARSNVQEYAYDPEANYVRVAEHFLPITPTFGVTGAF